MAGVAPRDHRAPSGDRAPIAPSGPDRAPIAPLGPDRAPIAPSGPDRAPIAPLGPDRAPIAPSGPDQGAIALSLLALLYKVTRRHPQQHRRRGVLRGFREGLVLSPELIFVFWFLGFVWPMIDRVLKETPRWTESTPGDFSANGPPSRRS